MQYYRMKKIIAGKKRSIWIITMVFITLSVLAVSVLVLIIISGYTPLSQVVNGSVSCPSYFTAKYQKQQFPIKLLIFIGSILNVGNCLIIVGISVNLVLHIRQDAIIVIGQIDNYIRNFSAIYLISAFDSLAIVVMVGYFLSFIVEKRQCMGQILSHWIIISTLLIFSLLLGISMNGYLIALLLKYQNINRNQIEDHIITTNQIQNHEFQRDKSQLKELRQSTKTKPDSQNIQTIKYQLNIQQKQEAAAIIDAQNYKLKDHEIANKGIQYLDFKNIKIPIHHFLSKQSPQKSNKQIEKQILQYSNLLNSSLLSEPNISLEEVQIKVDNGLAKLTKNKFKFDIPLQTMKSAKYEKYVIKLQDELNKLQISEIKGQMANGSYNEANKKEKQIKREKQFQVQKKKQKIKKHHVKFIKDLQQNDLQKLKYKQIRKSIQMQPSNLINYKKSGFNQNFK